jgi:hypothetical protein
VKISEILGRGLLGRPTQRRYEMMVQSKTVDKESLAVYTPDRWLVGQFPTKSNNCGRKWEQTRFFTYARNADHSDAPFSAFLGPHRSGTSCVAMVMLHLGVHMGNELGGYDATGGGEAIGLAKLCECHTLPSDRSPGRRWAAHQATQKLDRRSKDGSQSREDSRRGQVSTSMPIRGTLVCQPGRLTSYRRGRSTHRGVDGFTSRSQQQASCPMVRCGRSTEEELESAIAHVNPVLRKFG